MVEAWVAVVVVVPGVIVGSSSTSRSVLLVRALWKALVISLWRLIQWREAPLQRSSCPIVGIEPQWLQGRSVGLQGASNLLRRASVISESARVFCF